MNVLYNHLATIKNSFAAIREAFKSSWGIDYTGKSTAEYSDMLTVLTRKIDNNGARESFQNAFAYSGLTKSPTFDTSNATRVNFMYAYCGSITDISDMDLSNVYTLSGMCRNCTNLKTVSFKNFGGNSETIIADNAFSGCMVLESVSGFNASKVTTLSSVCDGCKVLTEIDLGNTSNCANFNAAFKNCEALETIIGLNFSAVTTASETFRNCSALANVTLSGIINISLSIADCILLTHDSLVSFINALAPSASGKILNIGSANLAKLTDEEKDIATGKGWAIT